MNRRPKEGDRVDTADWQSNNVLAEYPLTVEVKNNMFCALTSLMKTKNGRNKKEGTQWKLMEQLECGNSIPSIETNAFTGRST